MMQKLKPNFLQDDDIDLLKAYRQAFNFPVDAGGKEIIYLCGNSLGLQPKQAKEDIDFEMDRWSTLAVEGHFDGPTNWIDYHYALKEPMATIVGAMPDEVTIMNTLTVNLHLMMTAFYHPTATKYKILIDHSAFPSDRYAVDSFLQSKGIKDGLLILEADEGALVSNESIKRTFEKHGYEIAMVILGGVNYFSGQFYDLAFLRAITTAHQCILGLDLAHAAGNVPVDLHNNGIDFAVWCTYKYLNGGPGSLAGMFLHEQHFDNAMLTPLRGWWGQDRKERFLMEETFKPMKGAEAYQISNQPIFSLVPLNASLHLHSNAGIEALRKKSIALTSYLESLILGLNDERVSIITPQAVDRRGAQLSIRIKGGNRTIFDQLRSKGVLGDWRNPDVIRLSPAPIYNNFEDVYQAVQAMGEVLNELN